MMVRLAFAIMVQADADIMLIDEVLAVGDAAFAAASAWTSSATQRARGPDVVLVTHDMATVQSLCDRAMLLHDGELRFIGDPEDAALRYYRLNFADGERTGPATAGSASPDVNVAHRRRPAGDAAGERVENVEQGAPHRPATCCSRRRRELAGPASPSTSSTTTGQHGLRVQPRRSERALVGAGERVRIDGRAREPRCCPAATSSTAGSRATGRRARLAMQRACGCSTSSSTGRGHGAGARLDVASDVHGERSDEAPELRDVRGPVGARRRLAAHRSSCCS